MENKVVNETEVTLEAIEKQIQRLEEMKNEILNKKVFTKLIDLHKDTFSSLLEELNQTASYEISPTNNKLIITIERNKTNSVDTNVDLFSGHSSNVPTDTREKVVRKRPLSRAKLTVTFPDGTVVTGRTGKIAFAKAIHKIGYDKANSMGIVYSGIPLVSYDADPRKHYQMKIDDMYIFTFLNTKMRVEILNKISEKFDLGLDVQVTYRLNTL